MADFQSDIVKLMSSFFGEETGKFIEKFYDPQNSGELIGAADKMLSELLGPQNAKKHLKPILDKYNVKG